MSSHRGSYRGSWRGRGGGRGGQTASQPAPPSKPLGPSVDNIDIGTLLIEKDGPVITDVEYVASYNWLDVKSPAILVPGSPPAWAPPASDPQLKPDSAAIFRDINAARYASYPLEPAIRSVQTLQPDFDFQAVDIVGCGSTVGNLLRFAGSQSRPFRFDLDVIGGTVFFVRRESSPTELITDLRGYGHTFPEEYTTWDAEVRNSCSHQRIIRYRFGGLDILVRSETDGYVKQPDAETSSTASLETDQPSLVDVLGAIAVTSRDPSQNATLQIKMAGTKIPQEQIFDLKTRAGNKTFDMGEILPRLWVSQTPKFLIAYHKFGLFDKPEVKDVRQDVLAWEKFNGALLGRFHAVLKRIVDEVRDSDSRQFEVYCDGHGPLCISKQVGEGRRALPSNMLQSLDAEEKMSTSLELAP